MNYQKLHSRKIQVLKGEIEGVVCTLQDTIERTNRYTDRFVMTTEKYNQKWSPFFNPHLRLNDEEVMTYLEELKHYSDVVNSNPHNFVKNKNYSSV